MIGRMGPTIDPVTQGHAYQQMLLSYLGTDDPHDAQASTAETLRSLVMDAGDHLRTRPAENEWSVIELIGHIVDAELVYAGRYRWILSHDEPPLIGYDQDLWTARLGHRSADPADLLELFDVVRRSNLALWKKTVTADRARVGRHSERGPESYELSFQLIAGHDRVHIEQARRTLDEVRTG
jgi:hypothetical protein